MGRTRMPGVINRVVSGTSTSVSEEAAFAKALARATSPKRKSI
jgi:hypothetical protein